MREFLRKFKRRLEAFDIEHNRIIERNKIFIAIMSLAMGIIMVSVITYGIVRIVNNNNEKPASTPTIFRTPVPDEEVMADASDGMATTIPPITSAPPVTQTPVPARTPMPVPTPTPDPIIENIERPEDVVVNDSVMQESDKKDDAQNNSNKGNGGNVSNIKPENNDKYVNNATTNTYTDNGFYVKDGFRYYAKNGKTVSKVGIDVSIYQGDINWKEVKASGVDFVIIRLGFRGYVTGKLMLDSNFKKNIEGAIDAGLDVGIYFFSQAVTTKEAVEEAAMCIKYLKPYKNKITYPVAIDTEYVDSVSARTNKSTVTNKVRTDVCIAFCETIKDAGYKPMVYANKHWLLNNLQLSRLNNYDIWYAKYGGSTPDYDYDFTIWQYTGSGRVKGIVGDVDLNVGLKDYSGGKSDKPQGTKEPESTLKPDDTESPEETKEPEGVLEPDDTESPQETKEPESTLKPDDTESPQGTVDPESTLKPDDTESPQETKEPESTLKPSDTESPQETKEPESTLKPSDTESPQETKEPESTLKPSDTESPQETKEPESTTNPNNTSKPQDTVEPSKEPQPGETEEDKESTDSKEPTSSKEPTITEGQEGSKLPESGEDIEGAKE